MCCAEYGVGAQSIEVWKRRNFGRGSDREERFEVRETERERKRSEDAGLGHSEVG